MVLYSNAVTLTPRWHIAISDPMRYHANSTSAVLIRTVIA